MLKQIRRYLGVASGRNAAAALGPAEPAGEPAAGPRHVAIIMDGNGRWAQERGLPRAAGHQAGVEALKEIVRACPDLGIQVLTVYAFSTENWKRPKPEVDALMQLLVDYCRREIDELVEKGVRIRPIGRTHELPELQQYELQRAAQHSRHNQRLVLNLALNYGGQAELVDAFRAILARVQCGELSPAAVDEKTIAAHLYTAELPEPDLIIRTGGEMRLSNFLLWQAAYAEFWVTPIFWPDFGRQELTEALTAFRQRDRRYGSVSAEAP